MWLVAGCYFVTMHCQNVHIVFNFMETAYLRTSQNKSHVKFKAFTLQTNYYML